MSTIVQFKDYADTVEAVEESSLQAEEKIHTETQKGLSELETIVARVRRNRHGGIAQIIYEGMCTTLDVEVDFDDDL